MVQHWLFVVIFSGIRVLTVTNHKTLFSKYLVLLFIVLMFFYLLVLNAGNFRE